MKYLFGVDGGNTKTDYLLCDTKGNFIDMIRGGTCSHDRLYDEYEGTYHEMKKEIDSLFSRNDVKVEDVEAAAFGLAGCDFEEAKEELSKVIKRIGFKNFVVTNDSVLGIKAGTSNGVGVCSINGTMTSASGIDMDGDVLLNGGLNDMSSDFAGGIYIANRVVAAAYDEMLRFGRHTSLTKIVMDHLGATDIFSLRERIGGSYMTKGYKYTFFTTSCFSEANNGDLVAIGILKEIGTTLARTAAGVVTHLDFTDPVEIVMAGSVYVKGSSPILIDTFKEKVLHYVRRECKFILLMAPPVSGAIIWALEMYKDKLPTEETRLRIRSELTKIVEERDL
ncbi:MAG: BadF/BadG/BcrA/BcrD ATPase family protein [Bacilli bacterium]